MLQKELIKRLKGKYETKMDDKGWLNFSLDGILLCKVKYNGNCIINDDENLSDEYREKIADIQDEVLTVREYIGLYERAPQMKAAGVTEYKQLASFGDTVLAATYGYSVFHFFSISYACLFFAINRLDIDITSSSEANCSFSAQPFSSTSLATSEKF